MEIKLNYSDIPDIKGDLRKYILEETDLLKNDNGIWLEFGVYSGRTINYISKFTKNTVYGFVDSHDIIWSFVSMSMTSVVYKSLQCWRINYNLDIQHHII